MTSFTAPIETLVSDVYQHHVKVPDKIARSFLDQDQKRVVCTINGKLNKHCAIMSGGDFWFLLLNKAEMRQLKAIKGEEVEVQMEPDRSQYGMPMPEELQVLLDQDEEGNAYFHNLTPGKQRNLIHIVNKVKNVDSRINKALAIVDHLMENKGEIDFKGLNAKIKEYNQRNRLR